MHTIGRFVTVAVLTSFVFAASALMGAGVSAQATGLRVQVGAGEPGYAVNLFGASTVTVPVGSTVTFEPNWIEPHTVTFMGTEATPPPSDPRAPAPTNPGEVVAYTGTTFLNSGFIFPGQTFDVSFPAAGSFSFLCILHPGMTGSVEVVAAGSADISTQAQLDAEATATFGAALTALKAEATKLAANPLTKVANADGTTTWRVNTVGGFVPPSDVQQFFPASMDVKVGDTVVWESSVPTPHTVTFLGGTELSGPPNLEDPKISGPTPAPEAGYDGVGYVNSGVIGLGWPGGQSFSVKFAEAGSYPFICILHVDQGMGGAINVSAVQSGAPTPPATGSAGLGTDVTPAWAMMLLAAVTVAALGAARFVSGRGR